MESGVCALEQGFRKLRLRKAKLLPLVNVHNLNVTLKPRASAATWYAVSS